MLSSRLREKKSKSKKERTLERLPHSEVLWKPSQKQLLVVGEAGGKSKN